MHACYASWPQAWLDQALANLAFLSHPLKQKKLKFKEDSNKRQIISQQTTILQGKKKDTNLNTNIRLQYQETISLGAPIICRGFSSSFIQLCPISTERDTLSRTWVACTSNMASLFCMFFQFQDQQCHQCDDPPTPLPYQGNKDRVGLALADVPQLEIER